MPKPKKKNTMRSKNYLILLAIVVTAFALGYLTNNLLNKDSENVKVWAVDDSVVIPSGLESYLEKNSDDDCKQYRGTDTPDGVALYAIQANVDNRYVRMSYGCSDNLIEEVTIVAVKQDNGDWTLIPPTEYSGSGENPLCQQLEKYNINKIAEPECEDSKGKIQENSIE